MSRVRPKCFMSKASVRMITFFPRISNRLSIPIYKRFFFIEPFSLLVKQFSFLVEQLLFWFKRFYLELNIFCMIVFRLLWILNDGLKMILKVYVSLLITFPEYFSKKVFQKLFQKLSKRNQSSLMVPLSNVSLLFYSLSSTCPLWQKKRGVGHTTGVIQWCRGCRVKIHPWKLM